MELKGMTIVEFKDNLEKQKTIVGDMLIYLEDGSVVPPYFHVTEMGLKIKHFIDCGGTKRMSRLISLQLWTAEDFNNRIKPNTILGIIKKFEDNFIVEDLEIEVEYNTNTISLFSIRPHPTKDLSFILHSKKTDCLAPEKCLIPNKDTQGNVKPVPNQNSKQCNSPSCC